jgi:hypothetical protein
MHAEACQVWINEGVRRLTSKREMKRSDVKSEGKKE